MLPKRLLGIKLGSSLQEVDLDKELELTEIKGDNIGLGAGEGVEESLLIEVRVSGSSKKLWIREKEDRRDNKGNNLIGLMKRRIG
jgi:hypothetical protein